MQCQKYFELFRRISACFFFKFTNAFENSSNLGVCCQKTAYFEIFGFFAVILETSGTEDSDCLLEKRNE